MRHILFTLKGCNTELLNDESFVRDTVYQASVKCKSSLLALHSHKFDPQGVTCVALLAESHISIHTWPEDSSCAVDVYTCGTAARPRLSCDYIIESLGCSDPRVTHVKRI